MRGRGCDGCKRIPSGLTMPPTARAWPQLGSRLVRLDAMKLIPTLALSFTTVQAFVSPRHSFHTSTVMPAKAGVATPEELKDFVGKAGDQLLVVDVRNPDAEKEPGDQRSLAVAELPGESNRPQAQHLIWDRESASMPLPGVDKDTPIITHCGGGGRGQLAKDFLLSNGFTNVLNGGGPKETECWNEFGDK